MTSTPALPTIIALARAGALDHAWAQFCAAGHDRSDDPAALARCLEERASCRVCSALARADELDSVTDCDLFDDGVANSSCAPLP